LSAPARARPQAAAGARIPLSVPDLRGREAEYLARCVEENWVSSAGPQVAEMERAMAGLTGRRCAVATNTGSAALQLALLAAGVGPGDRVAVPDWTFVASVNAARHAGAEPVLIDVDDTSWTLDPALLAEALAQPDHGIKAVIAVHALGHPADMDALAEPCRAAGAALVEDAAGAIGATYRGRPAGGLGDAAAFSFNGNKLVTAGGGGMYLTDREPWADRARHLTAQARLGADYRHDEAGYNWRMTNIAAALGLAQLERLDEMLAARRAIAARYDEALAALPHDTLAATPRAPWAEPNGWLYSVYATTETAAADLVAHMGSAGIEARPFWRAMSTQPPYADASRLTRGVSERLSGRVVSLPSSSNLSAEDQERVIAALAAWQPPANAA